jgi:hypothetical protein
MGMNHVTRQQDGSTALALDCQTRVKNAGLGDGQDECVSQVVESRLLAAGGKSTMSAAHESSVPSTTRTEEALRTIASRLDRIAAAYIASIPTRSNGSR